jgi:CheY-like chemotaxis protein
MSTRRVLIVDDDFDIRDSLKDALEDEGYVVDTAADGLDALERLRAPPFPCLILLDWMMPRCDGPQFRSEQRREPAIADIPVVLLTADARLSEKVSEIGAQDCLKKPVHLNRLLEVIQRYCS